MARSWHLPASVGPLTEYHRKRDFGATPEPAGSERPERAAGPDVEPNELSFVIQKHAARRLHYDFRLELDGTLKSWAVPKGPSLDPGEKRLAVEVEDHPLDYADFEGAIPKGQYGGGSVIVWDRGRWEPESDPRRGLERRHRLGRRTPPPAPAGETGAGRIPADRLAATEETAALPSPQPATGRPRRAGAHAKVAITNPDRVFWPDAGITKRDLVGYLESVADRMVPELAGRPLTLLRCPEGIDPSAPRNGCFYQKHIAEGVPEALRAVEIEEKEGKLATYVVVESAEGLIALAQLGVLELHPWGSRHDHLDRPDRLIFDLDPDPGIGWERIVASARDLRDLLADLGLESFPRLTGGKGVHLVVPIEPEIPWQQARALTRSIARLLAERERGLYTLNPLKAKRRGRIFVDYLRNAFGSTAIASYSPRARPGAPVAVPIRWDELTAKRAPDSYTLNNVARRLRSLKEDPWAEARNQRLRPEILAGLGGS